MKLLPLTTMIFLIVVYPVMGGESIGTPKIEDLKRGGNWAARGYKIDPSRMSADEVDQRVRAIKRANYWKARGYNFNPEVISAFEMDIAVAEREAGGAYVAPPVKKHRPKDVSVPAPRVSQPSQAATVMLMTIMAGMGGTQSHHPTLNYQLPPVQSYQIKPVQTPPIINYQLPSIDDYKLPTAITSPPTSHKLGQKTKKGVFIGQYGGSEFNHNSTNNQFGAGSAFKPLSIHNQFGKYGSPFSPNSVRNPYATKAPKLYDSNGNYRGKLSNNPFDPESVSNPYGRYGSQFSSESINNPFGAGSPFAPNSPSNPFGQGLLIYGDE